MKKTSRVLAILLALALIVGMVPFSTKDVSAATDENYMLEASGAATAGVPIEATFTMQSSGVAQFAIAVATQCNVTYSFRNSAGETVYGPKTFLESVEFNRKLSCICICSECAAGNIYHFCNF